MEHRAGLERQLADHRCTGTRSAGPTWTGGFGHEGLDLVAGARRGAGHPGVRRPLHRGRVRRGQPRLARLRPPARAAAPGRDATGALQLVGGDRLRRRRGRPAGPRGAGREPRRRAVRDGRRLVRRPHQRPRRPRRLGAQPGPLPRTGCARSPTEVHRLGMRVRPVGRAGDGQPGQRPLPARTRTGCCTWPTATAPRLRHQLVLNLARPDAAEWAHAWLDRLVGRARHRLPQVGRQPAVHRGRLAGARRSGPAVDRAHPRGLPDHGPAAGRPPGPAHRGVRRRRRAGRPGHPRPHRPGVDRRTTPTRSTGSPSSTASASSTRRR